MVQRGAPGRLPRGRGEIHVAQLVLLVTNVALFLEHAQLRADGGVGGIAGELGHHLADGGAAAPVEDVHDLPLAAAERRGLHPDGHA